jgi:flagellar basal-body rod protein FlgC
MSTLNGAMRVSATGLNAERMRMDVISGNIANANSMRTRTEDAYRRRMVVLETDGDGVKIRQIMEDPTPLRAVADPDHPLADAQGYVYYSNVNPVAEMVNLLSANRAYEANVAAFNSAKGMVRAALNIGRM